MKKNTTPTWAIILAFLIVILISVGIFFILKSIWSAFINTKDGVNVAVFTSSATIILTIGSLILGKYLEKKKDIEQSIRQQKTPLYQSLMNFFIGYLLNIDELSEEERNRKLIVFMAEKTSELMIWGSPEVILLWGKFRTATSHLSEEEMKNGELLFQFEDIIKAMRKDIGQENKSILDGDILRLFINDIEKYLPRQKKRH